jgi:hypothetical protein
MNTRRHLTLPAFLAITLLVPATAIDIAGAAPPRCAGERATIIARSGRRTTGTSGPDVIFGTSGRDRISGGGGGDRICGRGGSDSIGGGGGNDRLSGDAGEDLLWGDPGNDNLSGGDGADGLEGGLGDDALNGGGSNDILVGDTAAVPGGLQAGLAQARAEARGPSDDQMSGGAGNDAAFGGGGQNSFAGGTGQNTCANAAAPTDCAGLPPGAPSATPISATFSFPITTYTFDVTDPDGEPIDQRWAKGADLAGDVRNCGSFTGAGETADWSHAHGPPDNCPDESPHPSAIYSVAVDSIGWTITSMYNEGSSVGTSSYVPTLTPPSLQGWPQ